MSESSSPLPTESQDPTEDEKRLRFEMRREVAIYFTAMRFMTDPTWLEPIRTFAKALEKSGVEFSFPGGSPQRHLAQLLSNHFGCENANPNDPLLKVPAVREAMKPFIAEVERSAAEEPIQE